MYGIGLLLWPRAADVPDVAVKICWHSKQGPQNSENRDYCGIGLRSDSVLCIVLDGATAGPKSGELASLIAADLIDWFMLVTRRASVDDLIDQMRDIHKVQSQNFQIDSASYLIVLIEDEMPTSVLHAGDCLIGCYNDKGSVDWLIQPHTLANPIDDVPIAEIAASALRNNLTRNFRSKEFMAPNITALPSLGEKGLVVATDGFWAGLDQGEQGRFLEGEDFQINDDIDDCSVLKISPADIDTESQVVTATPQNLYAVQSD